MISTIGALLGLGNKVQLMEQFNLYCERVEGCKCGCEITTTPFVLDICGGGNSSGPIDSDWIEKIIGFCGIVKSEDTDISVCGISIRQVLCPEIVGIKNLVFGGRNPANIELKVISGASYGSSNIPVSVSPLFTRTSL
jgi:hypothetical protein